MSLTSSTQAVLMSASLASSVMVPDTGLETLPVVYMGGNSRPRPSKNIEMLSKMRYVVIEKWEGPCWNECIANLTKHDPPLQCQPSCQEEQHQMATLAAVKKLKPSMPGIFYLNTILDFHFLELHQKYVEADALIHNVDGSLCQLICDGHVGMSNVTAFDYSKPAGQQLWLNTIKNFTNTGVVDGFYGDTMQIYAGENNETGQWELCKTGHNTCCTMTKETAQKYNDGKNATMTAAAEFLGEKAVFFKTTDVFLKTANPVQLAEGIKETLATMPYVHVYLGDQPTSHDPNDISSSCSKNTVASFLLAWQEGAFLGCNGWDDSVMGRPIGKPLSDMQEEKNVYWRNFSSGTSVVWGKNGGEIFWSS